MKTLNYKSVEIFLTEERIANHGWHQLLMNILREKSEEGARIRQACESHTSKLIQLGLSHNIDDVYQNQTMADVQFRVIEIVHLLAKYRPDYLNNQHLLLDHLKNIWMNTTFRQRFKSIPPPTPAPVNYREAILIGRIFLITVETNPESVEYLFQLQRINQMRTLAQFGKIKFWFKYRLMKVYTIDQQRTVINRFLVNWHKKKGYEDELKASIITNVIIPILEHSNQENTQNALLGEVNFNNDEDLVGQIIKTLIESNLSDQSDVLNVALLKLSHFLIKNCTSYIVQGKSDDNEFRFKRVLEFGQSLTESKKPIDPSTELNGYLLLSHMISRYDLPRELLLSSFEKLLKSYSLEIKIIVNEAIDILVTKINNLIDAKDSQDILVYYTRKVLVEEALTLRAIAQTSHVVQVIVRHGDKYYETHGAKNNLIPLFIHIMTKLGSSNTSEHRQLAVKLASMLVNWQKRYQDEKNESLIEKRHGDSIIHFIIKNMIQFFANSSVSIKTEMVPKCKAIFATIYKHQLWSDVLVRPGVFERQLADPGDGNDEKSTQAAAALLTLTELVRVVPETLNEIIRLQNQLKTLTTKMNDKRIRPAFCELIKEIVLKYPFAFTPTIAKTEPMEIDGHSQPAPSQQRHAVQDLIGLKVAILTQINEGLNQSEATTEYQFEIRKTLELVMASRQIPGLIDDITTSLVKIFNKLTKDHTNLSKNSHRPQDLQVNVSMIGQVASLMMGQVNHCANENRKSYIQSIMSLIENTESLQVFEFIINSVKEWINSNLMINKKEQLIKQIMNRLYQSIKLKLNSDPNSSEELIQIQIKYLDIVHRIYLNEQSGSSNTTNASDLLARLEAPYLWGLTYQRAAVRQKFFSLYDDWVPKAINDRLLFIFATQSWEALTTDFLPIALGLLLSALKNSSFEKSTEFTLMLTLKKFGLLRSTPDKDFGKGFQSLLTEHYDEIGQVTYDYKPEIMIDNMIELAHCSPKAGRRMWDAIFPLVWKLVPTKHQPFIQGHIRQFIRAAHPSHHMKDVATVIIQATNVGIDIKPYEWRYLASNYGLQGLAITQLEKKFGDRGQSDEPAGQTAGDVLGQLCKQLGEETWNTCVWERRAYDPNTAVVLGLMEQNKYEQAQQQLEKMMSQELERNQAKGQKMNSEYDTWRSSWISCCKELNSWEAVCEHAQKSRDAYLMAQCAWKLPDTWESMKQAVTTLEQGCPPSLAWKVHLYKGYLAIRRYQEPSDSPFDLKVIENHAKLASNEAIKAWRRLPRIVSVSHAGLLRAAHQIVELNEAAQIHDSLSQSKITTEPAKEQIKDTVKRWKNRLPLYSDPYSHWSDLVVWHHHQFQAIVTQYEQIGIDHNLGMHASATDLIYYARIARKLGLLGCAADSLQFISQIPSLTAGDCFMRIIEQIKCYLGAKTSENDRANLEVIDQTSLRYFKPHEQAEILALKAKLQFKAKIQGVDPNKTFSHAVQLFDSNVAWGLWAEHLVQEHLHDTRNLSQNVASALTALLQACRQQSDVQCRKYMANVIYCLSWDDQPAVLDVLDQIADR